MLIPRFLRRQPQGSVVLGAPVIDPLTLGPFLYLDSRMSAYDALGDGAEIPTLFDNSGNGRDLAKADPGAGTGADMLRSSPSPTGVPLFRFHTVLRTTGSCGAPFDSLYDRAQAWPDPALGLTWFNWFRYRGNNTCVAGGGANFCGIGSTTRPAFMLWDGPGNNNTLVPSMYATGWLSSVNGDRSLAAGSIYLLTIRILPVGGGQVRPQMRINQAAFTVGGDALPWNHLLESRYQFGAQMSTTPSLSGPTSCNADFGCHIFFDNDLTDDEIDGVERFIIREWGAHSG